MWQGFLVPVCRWGIGGTEHTQASFPRTWHSDVSINGVNQAVRFQSPGSLSFRPSMYPRPPFPLPGVGVLLNEDSDAVGRGYGPRFCIFANKLSDDLMLTAYRQLRVFMTLYTKAPFYCHLTAKIHLLPSGCQNSLSPSMHTPGMPTPKCTFLYSFPCPSIHPLPK